MDKKIDSLFLIALALIVVGLVAIIFIGLNNAANKAQEVKSETIARCTTVVATEATVPETTEAETECTEAETTEATLAVALYDVPLSDELQLHIIEQAEAHGIDPAVIFAMAWKESTYYSKAVGDGGNSYGLLQIQPRWHSGRMEKLGCSDLFDPYQNVIVGVDYLAENLNRYGSIEAALTAYNAGSYTGTVTNYAYTVLSMAAELRGESQ